MRKLIIASLIIGGCALGLADFILAQLSPRNEKPTLVTPVNNRQKLSPSAPDYQLQLSTSTLATQQEPKSLRLLAGEKPMGFDRRHWVSLMEQQERARLVAAPPAEGIEFNLPYESKLNISGRKSINMKYGRIKFKHPDLTTITGTPVGLTNGLDMQQELQVKIKGKVGPKIHVDIDYDDTKDDKRAISVMYKGDPDEVVQEAAFGDIDLSLPQTEFVAYNKKLFGGRIDTMPVQTENNRLRVMAIGSRTKGVTETKNFKGSTTFEKREVFDTQYVRRKYYKIFPDPGKAATDLPIATGSAEVYIDNKIGTDNNNATLMTVEDINGNQYAGYFDLQYPGIDYTLDFRTGIITFNKNITQNMVIAVDYRRPNGTKLSADDGRRKIVKDEFETSITREMKNFYSLGSTKIVNDPNLFLVKIMDLNRNELNLSSFPFTVDYDFGTIQFTADTPFDPPYSDVYANIPNHHFIIYVEYRHSVKTYNLRPNLVIGSETVKVDGRQLTRDEDYFIDYEIGLLTFLKDAIITDNTDIEVSYEYQPFGGQFEQTIVGARAEYEYGNNFTLGSTTLYNWATPPGNIPDVRSTPESVLVVEADSKLKLRPRRFWNLNLDGLKMDLGAEVAQSRYSPDTFGKTMIDDMEGSEISETISTDRNIWQLGSLNQPRASRGTLDWLNGDEDVKTINPNSSDTGREQVLDLHYGLPDLGSWVSLAYVIAPGGIDLSKHNSIKMYIFGSGQGEELHIDLGRINEDADGAGGFDHDVIVNGHVVWPKGSPKTEDLNGNGVLDVGEDTGWDFVNPDGSITKIGAGNGRLDSEDLDGDGILSTAEVVPNLTTSSNYPIKVNWQGWRQVILPLDINSANLVNWQNIKEMRIWMRKGASTTGTVRLANMEIVGNRYDPPVITGTGTMEVSVKSNEDNGDVSLKDNGDYQWLYKESVNKDLSQNKALVLKYTSLGTDSDASTRRQLTKSEDYSKHRKLRFFVFGDNNGETFYIRVGADDTNNYFEYRQPINWTGWQLVSIDLPNGFTSVVGTPSLENILNIRLGLIGNGSSGEIWVDEIHLTDPVVEIGRASKFTLDTAYTDWGTVSGKYRDMDNDFTMVGVPKINQSTTARDISSTITKLSILPVNFSWNKTTTTTPTSFRTTLSTQSEGIVISDNLNVGTTLTKENVPQVGLSFNRNNIDSNLQQKIDKTFTYGTRVSYNVKPPIPAIEKAHGASKYLFWKPLDLLIPDTFNSYYNRIQEYISYDPSLKVNAGFEDLVNETDDWQFSPTYQFQLGTTPKYANRLNFMPTYRRRRTAETKDLYSGDIFKRNKFDSQTVDVSLQPDLYRWIHPTFRYQVNTSETYSVDASSKNVNRSSTTEVGYLLRLVDLTSWKPVNSLNFNNRYKIDEGDIYENLNSDFNSMNKLWVRNRLNLDNLKSTNQQLTFETTARWLPLEFLNLQGGWRPFKTIDTTTRYSKIDEHRSTTGTPFDSYTKVWPDLQVTISELENFPKLSLFLEASQLIVNYALKDINQSNISFSREKDWSTKWRGKLFRYYTLILNTDDSRLKQVDQDSVLMRTFRSSAKGIQVNFRTANNYIWVFSYDDRKQLDLDRFGIVTLLDYSRTPAIKVDKDLEFPHGLKLPFIKKVFQLKNLIHFNSQVKTIIQRSNLADKNNNTYSAEVNMDYNVSYNFVVTFGLNGSLVKNQVLDINDYYTYGGVFKLLIRF